MTPAELVGRHDIVNPAARQMVRRLLATDLANHGLSVHIGAALLGHLNRQTFHGYVAAFPEDVIRHHQTHLANRRAGRPTREYRPPTDAEWAQFEEHFDNARSDPANAAAPTRPAANMITRT